MSAAVADATDKLDFKRILPIIAIVLVDLMACLSSFH